mgnify:CR=1 FL=1
MSNQLSEQYLPLLLRQVEEEIQFLVRNGHEQKFIPHPCIFCVSTGNYHVCRRLTELRQFQSSIANREVPKSRRAIGFEQRVLPEPIRGTSLWTDNSNLTAEPILTLNF